MVDRYEVVGIVTSGVSLTDCRSIDLLLYRDGEAIREIRPSQAYFDTKNGVIYYVVVDGERHELVPATKFNARYVRAAAEDRPDDPLLQLPEATDKRSVRP